MKHQRLFWLRVSLAVALMSTFQLQPDSVKAHVRDYVKRSVILVYSEVNINQQWVTHGPTTGFYVNDQGVLVTVAHVVPDAYRSADKIVGGNQVKFFGIVGGRERVELEPLWAPDKSVDFLVLRRTDGRPTNWLSIESAEELSGGQMNVFGYPTREVTFFQHGLALKNYNPKSVGARLGDAVCLGNSEHCSISLSEAPDYRGYSGAPVIRDTASGPLGQVVGMMLETRDRQQTQFVPGRKILERLVASSKVDLNTRERLICSHFQQCQKLFYTHSEEGTLGLLSDFAKRNKAKSAKSIEILDVNASNLKVPYSRRYIINGKVHFIFNHNRGSDDRLRRTFLAFQVGIKRHYSGGAKSKIELYRNRNWWRWNKRTRAYARVRKYYNDDHHMPRRRWNDFHDDSTQDFQLRNFERRLGRKYWHALARRRGGKSWHIPDRWMIDEWWLKERLHLIKNYLIGYTPINRSWSNYPVIIELNVDEADEVLFRMFSGEKRFKERSGKIVVVR